MPRVITASMIADFRERLCGAASELLLERGVEGFNMRELAKRLRVSPMTAYRYFKDKDEILAQLRTRGFAHLATALEQARDEQDKAAIVRAYIRFALNEPIIYRLMFDLFQPSDRETPELARQQRRVRAALNAAATAEASTATADDVLWSALHGAVALHLAGKIDAAAFQHALGAALRDLVDAPVQLPLCSWQTAAE